MRGILIVAVYTALVAAVAIAKPERTQNVTQKRVDAAATDDVQSWVAFTNMVETSQNWVEFKAKARAWGKAKKEAAEKAKKGGKP